MLNFIFTYTPLHYFVQSFWRDEAFSYLLAKQNILQIIFLSAKDFSPPLYFILLKFWMSILGSSEVALRSFSFVMFAATFYIFYLFLLDILKIKTKWIYFYLFLFLLNPFLNYYAFETRMYILFAFFGLLSYYSFWRRRSQLYLLSSLAGLYSHYFMILVIFTQGLFIFFTNAFRKKEIQTLAILFGIISVVSYYCLYTNNYGGSSYGARYVLALTPILLYYAAPILEQNDANKQKKAAVYLFYAAAIFSFVIAFLGALNPWINTGTGFDSISFFANLSLGKSLFYNTTGHYILHFWFGIG